MKKKIRDLTEGELNTFLHSAQLLDTNPLYVSLTELDPRNRLLLDFKTIYYRIRQEKARRAAAELTDIFKQKLADHLDYIPLTKDEMGVVLPQWNIGELSGEPDFVGDRDAPRPLFVPQPPRGSKEIMPKQKIDPDSAATGKDAEDDATDGAMKEEQEEI